MSKPKSRRNFLTLSAGAIGATLLLQNGLNGNSATSFDPTTEIVAKRNRPKAAKIPVILDTDIGGDIDDAWALALLLKSPELDLKMLLTDTGNPQYRGAVAGKYLEAAGRTDIPIGLGIYENKGTGPQESWLGDYKISDYPGPVYKEGVAAMIEMIMASPEPITLICIGPVPNIKAALEIEPRIVNNVKIKAMLGSLRYGYDGNSEITQETNVRLNPDGCRKMLEAFSDITITPLDTCGIVYLRDRKYRNVRSSQDPLIRALIESYDSWAEHVDWTKVDPNVKSSTLFDMVAVYLALSEKYVEIENLGIRVTDDGHTLIDENAKVIRCATAWKKLPAFEDWLVRRLLSSP